ncbi:MAG: T9SS type A sorting domain-containing protein [Candidatus Marinimicrobia bacterium]|nr:T9SS type A sorting domain-containing protein [Candidatus Neomarinimicrobiota bacterium]MCF7904696.1 T9SS type A sorting domain-containing protein [Candidatus Neomarinimicrobiota bacterium]
MKQLPTQLMGENIVKTLGVLFITLPVLIIGQVFDQSTYYPLNIGDWREYSTWESFYGTIHAMTREGVVDTATIDGNLYYKQFMSAPFYSRETGLYVREDSSNNVLYYNLSEAHEDTLCKFGDYWINNHHGWWVVNSIPEIEIDTLFGYVLPKFYSQFVPASSMTHQNGIYHHYRFSNYIEWRNLYFPGLGKVGYESDGFLKTLERMKIDEVEYPGYYQSSAIDTFKFTSEDMTFSEVTATGGFKYSFFIDFSSHPYYFSDHSIESLAFKVVPSRDYYSTSWHINFPYQDRAEILGHTESINRESTPYFDVLDGRFLPDLDQLSGQMKIEGRYYANWLPDIDSTATPDSARVMTPEEFEIWVLLSSYTVGTDKERHIPVSYSLSPAFPNPFNSTTTFSLEVPNYSDVQVEVYNLLGQQIWTRTLHQLPPGYHKAFWDGTNDFGKDVDSGVYLIRASSSEWSQSIRVALLK